MVATSTLLATAFALTAVAVVIATYAILYLVFRDDDPDPARGSSSPRRTAPGRKPPVER
jgi:hypothetical protein